MRTQAIVLPRSCGPNASEPHDRRVARPEQLRGDRTGGEPLPRRALRPSSCRAGRLHAPQLAADDLFDWQAQLTAALPQGTAAVCIDSTPDDGTAGAPACDGVGGAYAVKEFWTGNRLAAPPRSRSGSARAYGHDHSHTKRFYAHRGDGRDDHRPRDLGSGRHDLQRELYDL